MKIKILGPVLLLTLATRFAQAAEGDIAVETNNNSNNNNNNIKDIMDANLAAAPTAAATEQVVAVALDSQKARDALEIAVDMVEAAAKVFADEEVEEDDEYDEEELADADEGEDDEDEDEDDDEDEDEDDTAAKDEQNQDEALSVEGDDFHYADLLTVNYNAQTAQCKQVQSQQHQEQQKQQPQEQQRPQEESQGKNQQQQTAFQKRDTTQQPLLPPLHEALLHAEATAEVGGACIDSFVNFALRFRERCSIKCLKTFSHVFSNPNVLGILDCFGCSNFFVSGFYALGVDCAGIFAAYPKPANSTTGKPGTTMTTTMTMMKTTMTTMAAPGATNKAGVPPSQSGSNPKSTNDDSSDTISAGDYRLGPVKPEDAALPPLDFANMLKSLGQLTSGDLQGWLDIGSDLAKVVGSGAGGASKGQSGKSEVDEGEDSSSKEEDEAKAAASKDLFNKFVGKAASFADWNLTPETLDQTGVFDRVQSLGLV